MPGYTAAAHNDYLDPDRHLWPEEICQCCGEYVDDCTCPECPVCGAIGDPECREHGLDVMPLDPDEDGRPTLNCDGRPIIDPVGSGWFFGDNRQDADVKDGFYIDFAAVNGLGFVRVTIDSETGHFCEDLLDEKVGRFQLGNAVREAFDRAFDIIGEWDLDNFDWPGAWNRANELMIIAYSLESPMRRDHVSTYFFRDQFIAWSYGRTV